MDTVTRTNGGPDSAQLRALYDDLGLAQAQVSGGSLEVRTPIDGAVIAQV